MQNRIEFVGVARAEKSGRTVRLRIDENRVEKTQHAGKDGDLRTPTGDHAETRHVTERDDGGHVRQPAESNQQQCEHMIDAQMSKPTAKNEIRRFFRFVRIVCGGGGKKNRR